MLNPHPQSFNPQSAISNPQSAIPNLSVPNQQSAISNKQSDWGLRTGIGPAGDGRSHRRRPKAGLPVDPEHELHQATAWVLSVVDVAIPGRHLILRQARAGLRHGGEVDVVERVDELGAELEVAPADQRRPL